jgi:TM2 domain-containing membrane protein YozV
MPNEVATKCPQCGAPIDANVSICKFCGADIVVAPQPTAPNAPQYAQQQPQYAPPQYTPPVYTAPPQAPPVNTSGKSKITAGVLAILLGGLGIHKFYLGSIGLGIVYILFCWTGIPSFIGIIEGIIYLTSSDEKFYRKYGNR